jgi:hypothetical protein
MVIIHLHAVHYENEARYGLVPISNFENDKIDELWNLTKLVPSASLNENGMF